MFHGRSQVVHQRRPHQQVAQEGGQDGGPDDGMEALDVEDLDRRRQGEAARCQHHAAHHVEADPDAPGKLVAQVGGRAQPLKKRR